MRYYVSISVDVERVRWKIQHTLRYGDSSGGELNGSFVKFLLWMNNFSGSRKPLMKNWKALILCGF